MKVYTKTGDNGTSSLYNGSREMKSSLIFNVIGEIEELTSRIGIVCSHMKSNYLLTYSLRRIQRRLQNILTSIDTPITTDMIETLEKDIDGCNAFNDKLTDFILPGVNPEDAHIHSCRTQTRKVERVLWELNETIKMEPFLLIYINRLSDYFFVLARYVCKKARDCDCLSKDFN
jgi:cob(I)alamin adenosyltransferase